MNTDVVLRSFAAFLTAGWSEASALLSLVDQPDDYLADWTQANWEILVEAVLLPGGTGFLEVYGDGADCNGASSRVFLPEALPTHRILCAPAQGSPLRDLADGRSVNPSNMTFWGFVHWDGKTYSARPEFNAVLLEGDEIAILSVEDIEFCLVDI
jgi:hypothetical protein